jgi:hypothetical protein
VGKSRNWCGGLGDACLLLVPVLLLLGKRCLLDVETNRWQISVRRAASSRHRDQGAACQSDAKYKEKQNTRLVSGKTGSREVFNGPYPPQ